MSSTRASLPLALFAIAAGCSHELSGPTPTVSSLDPTIVCTEQLMTDVKIMGTGLSPLGEDTLTDKPLLALPKVTLQRSADLFGAAASDAPRDVPDDPKDPSHSLVHWTSQELMSFRILGLSLKPGIYGVTVTNANGTFATLAGAFAAVPPPTIT